MSSLKELLGKYKGAIASGSVDRPKTWFSLGPLSLNLAAGNVKGIRSGRIVQIVGKYSSGKSTLALEIVKQHQQAHPEAQVLYVDFERAYDLDYAKAIGVDTDRLIIVRADTTEDGFTILESVIKTGDVRLVIIDSIVSANPASEESKDYNDNSKMGGNSGIITRFCNRIIPLIDNYDVLLVILNQLRANFNTMSPEREIPAGPFALRHHTSLMIRTTAIKTTENETEIQAVVKKNRNGAPQKVAKFIIKFGRGIDTAQDIIQLAIDNDIINKSGAWYSYAGTKVQGAERAAAEFPIDELRELVIGAVCE